MKLFLWGVEVMPERMKKLKLKKPDGGKDGLDK